MTIYVDAWLDCKKPRILVKNKNNNEILANFNSQQINKMFRDGDICCEDFHNSDLKIQLALVKDLLLVKAKMDIRKQIKSITLLKHSRKSFQNNILPFVLPKQNEFPSLESN